MTHGAPARLLSISFLFFFAVVLILPARASAALININTADQKTLESLPHIGTATAQKIIAYREANGPYITTEDIRKASTYISASYYTDIAPLITVGDTGTTGGTDQEATTTATTTLTVFMGGSSTYVPPPSALSIDAGPDMTVYVEVPFVLSALVKTKSGAADPAARINWSFGDGSSGEGSSVEKVYRYAGVYLVTVTATDSTTHASDDLAITVLPAQVRIAAVTGEGITLANDSIYRLNLSLWHLSAGLGTFRIPAGTTLLPGGRVLFPNAVTNLPVAFDATLSYPDGLIAARYMPTTVSVATTTITDASLALAQPAAPDASYTQVQKVDPIISITTNSTVHEDGVHAPTATTELAAVGAAIPPAVSSSSPVGKSASGVLHSPWALALLGIVGLAGGAFILL